MWPPWDPRFSLTCSGPATPSRSRSPRSSTVRAAAPRPGPCPAACWAGLSGWRASLRLAGADPQGRVVPTPGRVFSLTAGPQRAAPDTANTTPSPPECAFDPFPKGLVMGLPKGWAADPAAGFSFGVPPPIVQLAPGTYKVTATIAPQFVRLLHITAADATASVKLRVVKG